MALSLEDVIFDRLAEIPGVRGRVGSRIYRGIRPQGTPLPAITFQRISTTPVNSAEGQGSTIFARFQIDCWAATQSFCRDLADAVRGNGSTGLGGWTRLGSGAPLLSMVHLMTDTDQPEPPGAGDEKPIWRIRQDYHVEGTE